MLEKEEYFILQEKFREWFGKTVPVAAPLPDEADHPMGKPTPGDLSLPADTDIFSNESVPASLPIPEKIYINDRTQKENGDDSQDLLELLGFGFRGAFFFGAGGVIISLIINFNFLGWYNNDWLPKIIIVCFAMLLGFFIGLSQGYIYQLREKYYYNGEFTLNTFD